MSNNKQEAPFGNLAPWSEPAWSHGIPSPYYNESHKKYRNALREYINTNILPDALDWVSYENQRTKKEKEKTNPNPNTPIKEESGSAPLSAQLAWARSGFSFSDVPLAYRPHDVPFPAGIPVDQLDAFHLLISTDETSRVEGGVTSSLGGGTVIGIPPVIHHGTESQKRKWLPGLFSWETSFCLGVTEPR